MRSAIVCMTHCPFYLSEWVEHHQEMGFDRIYLRLEGPDTGLFLDRFKNHPIVRVLEYQYYPMGDQMERQTFLVLEALKQCQKDRIDFLLHIDDDELFFLYRQSLAGFLENYRGTKDYLHFKNVEAVYPESEMLSNSCFQKTKWFRPCFKKGCRGYGNGKSMACVSMSPSIRPNGVHFFLGEQVDIDPEEALILHFESCDFEQWKWKFSRPNPSDFRFYEESRETIRRCEGDSSCLASFYRNRTGLKKEDESELLFLG